MQGVVVGVDGAAASGRAFRWAADHAWRAEVETVHARTTPDMGTDRWGPGT